MCVKYILADSFKASRGLSSPEHPSYIGPAWTQDTWTQSSDGRRLFVEYSINRALSSKKFVPVTQSPGIAPALSKNSGLAHS